MGEFIANEQGTLTLTQFGIKPLGQEGTQESKREAAVLKAIQELLSHSDVRTTMIYTHTIQSRTVKEAKSPLDF